MSFIWETPEEINLALAQRLRGIRKRKILIQQQLSEKTMSALGASSGLKPRNRFL